MIAIQELRDQREVAAELHTENTRLYLDLEGRDADVSQQAQDGLGHARCLLGWTKRRLGESLPTSKELRERHATVSRLRGENIQLRRKLSCRNAELPEDRLRLVRAWLSRLH